MKEAGEREAGQRPRKRTRAAPGRHAGGGGVSAAPDAENRALDVLRRLGAHHIERAQGSIDDGDWTDFDPLSVPQLIR